MFASIRKTLFVVVSLAAACRCYVVDGRGGAGRRARLSLAEPMPSYYYTNIDGQPGTYAFGYDIADPASGNTQFRTEQRYPNGTVVGSYGYLDAYGRPLHYEYIADAKGYRVKKVKSPSRVQETLPPAYSKPLNYYTESSIDEQPEFIIVRQPSGRQPLTPPHHPKTQQSQRSSRPHQSLSAKHPALKDDVDEYNNMLASNDIGRPYNKHL